MKKEEIIQAVNQYILEDKMNDARWMVSGTM